ncbi:LysR family transcriptional regulator [Piscinibacter koreensis]|uniref:LysR family transcriptional regulator n=1 Tax=Piscinibacter koreensis TaxID=2742824 RepID=A0A7Y6NNU5_9BURK|nr:LysR family transcriptional regulator [Schlegelella koreensis]NUZ06536.1 LysR family transcriptional regulator [Schlegelella koreensis]
MDLRDLRYFETIAKLQHMGKAAAELHRTQPALTSAVRRLEADCGSPLFERSGRGIRLSPAGEVLLRWAQRLRTDTEDAQRELAAIGQGLAGDVRVGIVPTAAEFLLPAAARELLQSAPNVTLRIVVGLIDTLKPLLRDGEIDLMVGTESSREPGYTSRIISEDAIVVAASADHEVFRKTATLKDLGSYRWALQPPGAPTRDWLDHAFDRKRLPRPQVQVETTMLLMLPSLIAETGLLSFISRHHLGAPRGGPRLKEVPIRDATMLRRLVVAHRQGGYLSAAALTLIELLGRQGSGGG